jgi:hypothetical protein
MLKRLNFAGELLTDRTLLETAFDQYVRNERTAAEIRYPRLWKRRFLEAEDRNSQVRLTASRDQPDVICWIPACYDLKVVRELFHNQIRPENLKPRIEEFQKVWQRQKLRTSEWIGEFETRKDKVLPVFEKKIIQLYPEMTQLPRDLTVRRAGEIDWWDISAYDYRVRKLNSPVTDYLFECYRMESGKVILSHSEKDRLLKDWRNGRAAITRRLGEINDWFLPTVSQE